MPIKKILAALLTFTLCALAFAGCAGQPAPVEAQPSQDTPQNIPSEDNPSQPEASVVADAATLVFKNGTIQTMVREGDTAQAVAIKGDEIAYVGDDAGVEAFIGPDTQVIDLNGQFLSPGFMDGHIHGFATTLTRLYEIDLTGLKTNDEYLSQIKAFIDANPDLEYYTGGTFMMNTYQMPDGSNPGPQKEDLDEICADKPIVIKDVSYHSVWVNSKALELGGITKDTANPSGGVIHRNAAGEPSGFLTDSASLLVTEALPEENYPAEKYEKALDELQKEANSFGITGITNLLGLTSYTPKGGAKVSSDFDKAGKLTLRMRLLTTVNPEMSYEEMVSDIKEFEAYNSDMLKAGTVKMFFDGVTEGATAVMLDPYKDEAGHGHDWHGDAIWKYDQFEDIVKKLDADGYQVHVHAIGDGAVNQTLNAFEAAQAANGEKDSRFTMTHVCAIQDSDIKRNADLGVINALQFLWMYADPLYELEAAFIGTERAMAMYPTKKMIDAGCIISGASDSPVTLYNVLEEIEVGVTRNSPYSGEDATDMHRWPEQALTAYQMLEAYTKNVAYENFMDDIIGTVEVGKKADLVVLEKNILAIDPKEISDTAVVYTISNGNIVYSK